MSKLILRTLVLAGLVASVVAGTARPAAAGKAPGAITLAVDAMGGDRAPLMVIEGLEISAERHPGARFLLVGDEAQLAPHLERHKRAAASCTSGMRPR